MRKRASMPVFDVDALGARARAAGIGAVRMDAGGRTESLLTEVRAELTRIGNNASTRTAELTRRLEALEAHNQDVTTEIRRLQDMPRGPRAAGPTLGAQVVASDTFKDFQAGKLGKSVKMVISTSTGSSPASGDAGPLIEPQRDGVEPMPRRRLSLRALLNEQPATSNLIEFAKQEVRDNQAAPVAETTQKPESNMGWILASTQVRTIAHYIKVSEQAFADAAALRAEIDGELTYGLNLQLEEQLLSGSGVGQNLEGLTTAATAFNGSPGATWLDTIRNSIRQCELADVPATGIILNTGDWFDILGLKDADGRYLIPGGPMSTAQPALWGLPVVPTNSMSQGQFLTGALGTAARLYTRQDVTIELGYTDDDFIKNIVVVRAEMRVALAIRQPLGLVYGELPAVTG